MIENDNQMIYVSPDHWAAIHDEVGSPVQTGDFSMELDLVDSGWDRLPN